MEMREAVEESQQKGSESECLSSERLLDGLEFHRKRQVK